ncbi:hypothetical protein [Aquisalinus flavus]|nr:hypothetical protein [Aquisalinus flavus]MBD0425828.1 hypothetical protein [Aquisalinus flavus]UNE48569.1 hypothetical protein FF099_11180 [Aquisalinus flavus]
MIDGKGTLEPDLEFLRALVDGGGNKTQYLTGHAFVVGGSLYAFQCIANWLLIIFALNMPGPAWLVLHILPTVIFIVYCIWQGMRYGIGNTGNATSRAITAAFQAAGVTNLALILIFAPAAIARNDFTIWLFHPAIVFALQGAAWLTAFQLRRRVWLLGVALGWMASAIALGLLIGSLTYLLVAGLALFFFMTVPGIVMMRLSKKQD